MACVILAWELGGGWGHAVPLAQLARQLLDRGHRVHLVWKDLSLVGELPGLLDRADALHRWQAPIWPRHPRGLPEPATYAEVLLRAGYGEPRQLLGCAVAWRQLFEAIGADLLLADHAPTALLAARGLPLRVAMIGNGFTIPPAAVPLPAFRDRKVVAPARIEASEAAVLAGANAVLAAIGAAPLAALHELLQADEHFLLGWPELDHLIALRGQRPLPSWGWPTAPRLGAPPQWPTGTRKAAVFAYLWPEYPALDAVVDALRRGPGPALAYVAGFGNDDASRLGGGALSVIGRLVDLDAVLGDAELVLCHAGSGTVYAALQRGVPVLMLPLLVEQQLLARRVVAAGAGVMLGPGEVETSLAGAIAAIGGSPGFAAAARALAQRQLPAGEVMPRIAARCEALSAPAR